MHDVDPTPTQASVMQVAVTVPDGLRSGDEFTVAFEGAEYTISVPPGVRAGESIDVEMPCAAPEAAPAVTVAVPDGCYEDDEFTVDHCGHQFVVCVPAGCGPGDEIAVEVPLDATLDAEEPASSWTPQLLVGRRVELHGLVSKGLLNGRRGTVLRFLDAKQQFLVAIDGMCPDVAVRCEHVAALPEGDEAARPDYDDEPPEAPPAGVHYVGDRVLIERSSGRRSLATIVEFDEVFETYTVDVGHGLLKYGVEESYIAPYETSDEWAGPTRRVDGRWEGFFVGRRVRIPAMLNSSEDDDKNGAVVGYDARTGFYAVELDSGLVRRSGLLFRHIKVVYQLRDDEVYT